MLLNPGTVLSGRYEIIEKIGSGGMAVVYRGKDRKLDRYVTVKVLREEFIGDEEFIERFNSEACSAARLSHPNIVRAYDVGEDGDVNYIVNEYIHGDTLKKAIKEKAPFDSRSTINVAIQIASALSQAHKAHIVHRDIKPQNILVGTDGVVKVTDFGIARAATASTMTTTANAAGSVHYFSPEQARGGYVDEKSDIYSLGISMFEMITGVLPFQGNNSVSIALMHINDELPDIRQYNPNCSRSLEGIIKKATMKKADERYASIDLLLADLIRARAEITGARPQQPAEKKEEPVKEAAAAGAAAGAGVRMSRRAEAAAKLREAQEKAAAEKAAQAAVETPQETKPADPKELEMIRANKKAEPVEEEEPKFQEAKMIPKVEFDPVEEEEDGDVNTPLVSFEKYGKKLKMAQISKEDEYENEYVKTEPVKTSRRPERVRRNPRTEDDYDNERDRKTERKVIIAAVLTALVIIGIISAVGIRFMGGGFGGFTSAEQNIETPLFLGVPYEDAVKAAEEMGITLVQEGEDYSSFYDTGYIIYQSVSEGTMIGEGTKIGVKVSLGLTEEEMPDVMGKKEKDALEAIIRLVGDVAKIEYVNDPEADPMTVIEQEPAAGETITAKSNIVLKISKGDEDSSVVVPNVVNETLESAKASLEAVGLTVGSVSEAASDRIAAGKVMTQTLAADTEVSRGSVVNLVVSTGAGTQAPETSVPSANQDQNLTQGTKYFTINAPSNASGSVYVRVVRTDMDGAFPAVDEYREVSEFPYSVAVTGRGSGTVTCYLNGAEHWTQSVNFSD